MLNEVLLAANRNQTNIGYPKLGYVSDCNPQNSSVTVILQPDDSETGWMPYCTPWIGWYSPPKAGDQVLVLFQEGSKGVPIGCLLLYHNSVLPPSGVALGEAIWHHSTGSFIKLQNDGKININGNVEVDISAPKVVITTTGDTNITAQGNVNIHSGAVTTVQSVGSVSVTGSTVAITGSSITMGASGGSTDSLVTYNAMKSYVDTHTHVGVQGGPDTSGVPSSPMPSGTATTVIKGQ